MPNTATLTAEDIFYQIAEWEGAPPAYLCTYPLDDVASVVLEFTDVAGNAPNMTTPGFWISVDLIELQAIAQQQSQAFHDATGEWPY